MLLRKEISYTCDQSSPHPPAILCLYQINQPIQTYNFIATYTSICMYISIYILCPDVCVCVWGQWKQAAGRVGQEDSHLYIYICMVWWEGAVLMCQVGVYSNSNIARVVVGAAGAAYRRSTDGVLFSYSLGLICLYVYSYILSYIYMRTIYVWIVQYYIALYIHMLSENV